MPAPTRTSAVRPVEMRSHNLGLILTDIHRLGTCSRAELTRRTGLNRSTIGALVNELVALGLVAERRPEKPGRAGRPSHLVAVAATSPYAVAVSVEIDRVVAAGFGLGGALLHRVVEPVPTADRSPEAISAHCARLVGNIETALGDRPGPIGVGVSVPGMVRAHDQTIAQAPNLEWRDVALAALLTDRLPRPLPIRLGNDADLGALAESRRGVGRECANLVFIIGRIGLGGGVIVDGRPLHGTSGYAGEFGHIMIDPDGPACHCGGRGCWETKVSELRLLELAGRTPGGKESHVADIVAAAGGGDRRAQAAIAEISHWAIVGLGALTNIFNPELIVVGGSLGVVLQATADDSLPAVRQRAMPGPAADVRLALPALGGDAALYGAAELAFGDLLADPLRYGVQSVAVTGERSAEQVAQSS